MKTLTPSEAWELLNEYNKGEFHLKHGRIVGDVMALVCGKARLWR